VRVGENALAFDDDARSGDVLRRGLGPGVAVVQGLNGSGRRRVLKILTTEFSTAGETGGAAVGGAVAWLASWAWSVQLASAIAAAAARRTIFMNSLFRCANVTCKRSSRNIHGA